MPNGKSTPASAAPPDFPTVAQKSEDQWTLRHLQVNRMLNRPLAGLLVRALLPTRVTPNQVTWASFVVGLAAAGFLFAGRPWAFLVGGVLTQLSSIIDCADGMLARARGQTSEFGAYLDLLLDRINEFFILAGSAFGFYRYTGRIDVLMVGFLAVGFYFLQTSLFYLTKIYAKDDRKGETAENRGWLLFLIFVFTATTKVDYGLWTLLVVSVVVNLLQMIRFLRRQPAGD